MSLNDPVRRLIVDRTKELRIGHADLSRALGKGASYINQYLNRGSPVQLGDRERMIIAKLLEVDEVSLRADADPAASTGAVTARNLVLSRSKRFLPVFTEGGEIDFDRVGEWTERPEWVTMSEQSFALWIIKDHGRLAAGDLAYVAGGRPVRPMDIVVILTMDQRHLVAIGVVSEIAGDKAMVTIHGGETKSFNRRGHIILKIAAIRLA